MSRPAFDELGQRFEVTGSLLRGVHCESLADERGEGDRAELPADASGDVAAVLAADDGVPDVPDALTVEGTCPPFEISALP